MSAASYRNEPGLSRTPAGPPPTPSAAPNPFDLGLDLFTHIAGFLRPQDLIAASSVCWDWRSGLLASSDAWRASWRRAGVAEPDPADLVFVGQADSGGNHHRVAPDARTLHHLKIWRDLAFNHMRTANSWENRRVRTSYDRWELEHGVGFHVHSATGALVALDYQQPDRLAVLDRSTRRRIGDFRLADHNNLRFVKGFASYTTSDYSGRMKLVLARLVPQQPRGVTLEPLAYMDGRASDRVCLVPAATPDGVMLVDTTDGNVRFRAPPFATDFDMVSSMLHAPPGRCDGIPHLTRSVVAVISNNETSILARVGRTTEHRATFPMTVAWHPMKPEEVSVTVAVCFRVVDRSALMGSTSFDWFTTQGRLQAGTTFPPQSKDLVLNVVKRSAITSCFNHRHLCAVLGNGIVLFLQDYARVFEEVVRIPKKKQRAYFTKHTLAIQFSTPVQSIAVHSNRFAIATAWGVVVVDSRQLPNLPLPEISWPQRHEDISLFGVALKRSSLPHIPTRQADGLDLGIDSRAVYWYDDERKLLFTHDFGQ